MTHFNRFALTMHRLFGERMKTDEEFCKQVWSSLANVDWTHVDGDKGDYSFRSAGGLISDIREEGCYMDWYCSGPDGVVSEEIATALAAEGWSYKVLR